MSTTKYASSSSKHVRLCGHWIKFSSNKNNEISSNFSSIIFFTPIYFKNIVSFLLFTDNIRLKLICSYHNNLYNNPNNKLFLKKLICYDYTKKILKLERTIHFKKMYTNYNYMNKTILKLFRTMNIKGNDKKARVTACQLYVKFLI